MTPQEAHARKDGGRKVLDVVKQARLDIPLVTVLNGMTFHRKSEPQPNGKVKVTIEVRAGGEWVGVIRQQRGGWVFWQKGRLGRGAWLRSGEGKVWAECGELKKVVAGAMAEKESGI